METYRIEIKYNLRYPDTGEDAVFAEYPHCTVERYASPNGIILHYGTNRGIGIRGLMGFLNFDMTHAS